VYAFLLARPSLVLSFPFGSFASIASVMYARLARRSWKVVVAMSVSRGSRVDLKVERMPRLRKR
jgi:hypothetical protein